MVLQRVAVVFSILWAFFFGFAWLILRLYSERNPYQRRLERLLLFWFVIAQAYLFGALLNQDFKPCILSQRNVFMGAFAFVLTLYVIFPIRLSYRFLLFMLSPFLVLFISYRIFAQPFQTYYSLSQVIQNFASLQIVIGLTSVLCMYIMTGITMYLIYKLIPIYQKHIGETYSDHAYDILWLRKIGIFYTLCMFSYTLRLLWIHPISQIFYTISFMSMFWMVIDHVFKQKVLPPQDAFQLVFSWKKIWIEKNGLHSALQNSEDETYLQGELKHWLENDKPYLNSDFCAEDIFARFPKINRRNLAGVLYEVYRTNFMNTVQKLRIEEAKRQIKSDPSISFKELSYHIGFANQSAFTRSFKQITGMSPSEFRRYLTNE